MLKDLINNENNDLSHSGVAVYVVKNYDDKYVAGDSFTARNPAVLLMKSGRFKIQLGENIQDLEAHDLLVFPKKSHCEEMQAVGKLQFYLIRFSSDRSKMPGMQEDSFLYLTGKETVKIALEQSDYLVLSLIFRLIYAEEKNTAPTAFSAELQRISSNLMLFELKLIYAKYLNSAALHASRAEKIVMNFLTILSIHCRKHHSVQFYAGVLYVTPDYLNKMVKEITGKPVKKLITEAVLAEAVNLLDDSGYTIAAISEELDFSSISSFDIFFKKWMHCTPSEYRSNAAEKFKGR